MTRMRRKKKRKKATTRNHLIHTIYIQWSRYESFRLHNDNSNLLFKIQFMKFKIIVQRCVSILVKIKFRGSEMILTTTPMLLSLILWPCRRKNHKVIKIWKSHDKYQTCVDKNSIEMFIPSKLVLHKVFSSHPFEWTDGWGWWLSLGINLNPTTTATEFI